MSDDELLAELKQSTSTPERRLLRLAAMKYLERNIKECLHRGQFVPVLGQLLLIREGFDVLTSVAVVSDLCLALDESEVHHA